MHPLNEQAHYLHLLPDGHTFSAATDLQVASHATPHAPPLSAVLLQTALHRCSRAMGLTDISILKNNDSFMKVVNKAETFLKVIETLLPHNFSAQYKNPCWEAEQPSFSPLAWKEMLMDRYYKNVLQKEKESEYVHLLTKPVNKHAEKKKFLLCLPYFFLAGFPKSATTTIHYALIQHWQIEAPSNKEPHWWTRKPDLKRYNKFSSEYISMSFIVYTLFFKGISLKIRNGYDSLPNRLITFDGSQSTLWDSNFFVNEQDYCAMPAVINRVLPNAKFIVVMRNPATRLYSHFFYSCQLIYGKYSKQWPSAIRKGGAELFHRKVVKDIDIFNECINTTSVFECSSRRTASRNGLTGPENSDNCGRIWHRLTLGLYVVHIKKWLQFYPIRNFFFIRMEDISKDPYATMASITDFLEIETVPKDIAEGLLKRKNTLSKESQSLGSLELLENFYSPYNEELAKLLNDDRFLWQDQDHE